MSKNQDQAIIFPDYKNTIVNMMASIQTYYGADTDYETIKILDRYLEKKYKHVVMMIFDGMGSVSLKKHLGKTEYLRRHMVASVQSVMPPTTTAAMTSYYTGMSAAEHGWLGWSLYFRDYGAMVDVFTNFNSYSGKEMVPRRIGYREMPYTSVYEKMHKAKGDQLEIHTIKPEDIYFPSNPNRHHPVKDFKQMKKAIIRITGSDKETFTQAYWPNPDMIMHEHGPDHEKVKNYIKKINDYVKEVASDLKDTLLIVSADHGLTSIEKEIDLEQDPELKSMLIIPPSVEGRCASFFIKPGKKEAFKKAFDKKYGTEFILYTHEEVINKKLFGYGTYHEKFSDFIGDYVAVATKNSIIHYKITGGKEPHHFKGHHAGVTKEEVEIPLIIVEKK